MTGELTAEDIRRQTLAIDMTDLEPIVQSVLDDDSAIIHPEIIAEHITAASRRGDTAALLRIDGRADVGGNPLDWSAVLKVVVPPDTADKNDLFQGGRELAIQRSGVLNGSNAGMRVAKLYDSYRIDGFLYLWIEDLKDMTGPPWELEHFVQAARGIGEFSGAFSLQTPAAQDWMSSDLIINRWGADKIRHLPGAPPELRDQQRVRDYISGKDLKNFHRLVDGIDKLRAHTSAGLRTLCHGDCHARNLFVTGTSASDPEVVAIDWAGVGLGPLGTDIGTMVGSSLTWGDHEAEVIIRGEREIFAAYFDGLRAAGSEVSESEARISYIYAAGGYGTYLASFAALVDAQLDLWEFVVERFGNDADHLEQSCFERLEFAVGLVEEGVALLK